MCDGRCKVSLRGMVTCSSGPKSAPDLDISVVSGYGTVSYVLLIRYPRVWGRENLRGLPYTLVSSCARSLVRKTGGFFEGSTAHIFTELTWPCAGFLGPRRSSTLLDSFLPKFAVLWRPGVYTESDRCLPTYTHENGIVAKSFVGPILPSENG